MFAALNCIKECAAEVKTAVGDIRSNLDQESRSNQDALAKYLDGCKLVTLFSYHYIKLLYINKLILYDHIFIVESIP